MVAIDVEAVGGIAPEGRRPIGIGARHHDDSDAVEQPREFAAGERTHDREHRLGAGRLVAVLLPDQPYYRAAERADIGSARVTLLRRHHKGNVAPLLRLAERSEHEMF